MPPLSSIGQHQQALLWEYRWTDGEGQSVVSETPEELTCQWVDKTRFMRGPDGQQVQIDAMVALRRDAEVPLNSLMFQGTLHDYTTGEELTVMQVVWRNEAADLKGRMVRREYGLAFYRGKLPTVSGP